jgi:4'-phosphopantetheinyl transferase EntD
MPVVKIENIREGVAWGLWKIDENYDKLINSIPFTDSDFAEFSKISNQKRRMEWLGARMLVKNMLENWNLPYNGLIKDAHEKPFLHKEQPFVSLAHCFPYATIMLDSQNPCGIDIEKPKETLYHISHKFLNKPEIQHINGNLEKLCIAWAIKEVLFKIQGKKYLSFQENMLVEPFDAAPHQIIKAQIRKDGITKHFKLMYHIIDDHYICYNT